MTVSRELMSPLFRLLFLAASTLAQWGFPPPPPGGGFFPPGFGRHHGGLRGGIPPPGLFGDLNPEHRRLLQEGFGDIQHGGRPPPDEFRRQTERFCRWHPDHPICANGPIKIQEIVRIIDDSPWRHFRRRWRVNRLNIRDPLRGVPVGFHGALRRFEIGNLPNDAATHMRGVCRRFKCREQRNEFLMQRRLVFERIGAAEFKVHGRNTSEDVEERLDRILQVKKELLKKAGLENEVEPADDGVFQKDILLTKEQSDFLLNELGKAGEEFGSEDERAKRSSLFLEEAPTQKWDPSQPILYTFDSSLEEFDKNDVRRALNEIQSKSCLKFQYSEQKPSTNHLYYTKVDNPQFCGLSYIGRVDPANIIYLSFQCGNVDWSNINPQNYDYFAIADVKLFTTYGVKYDYGSIMHYGAYTAATDISKPTMIPKVNPTANQPLLGQRDGMSATDVELLTKMYCKPGCTDNNVYCGAWALLDYCIKDELKSWMEQNCKKSCNFC